MALRMPRTLLTIRPLTQRSLRTQWVFFSTSTRKSQKARDTSDAELQSQATKEENFQKAAEDVGIKMQAAPHSITSEEANHLKSREARATGQAQPPSDSISAEAQRLAAENEGATKQKSSMPADPVDQSAVDRTANFEQAAREIAAKMERSPESISKEDAGLMHSREQKAFGSTAKGGIASTVHKVADENDKKNP